MVSAIKRYLNQPVEKPEGWKDYPPSSPIGRLSGKWHIRYDYAPEPAWRFVLCSVIETILVMCMLLVLALGEFVLWLGRLVPDLIKWSAVLVVGVSIAIAVSIFGVAIGVGLLADLSYTELMQFAEFVIEGERNE